MLLTLCSTSVFAQDDGWGDKNNNGPHLMPPNIITLVTNESTSKTFSLLFNNSYESVNLTIYKDSQLIIVDNFNRVEIGQSFVYSLIEYGAGVYTAYIKIGEDLLYVFEEEIDN